MKISKVSIKNFRGIESLENFELKNLSILIGNNGTCKTSILEAINFCLSPHFLSGRIKHTDFFNGSDQTIQIIVEFDGVFKALLPDGYTKQAIECNKVFLEVKRRDRAAPSKAFSDTVVVSHYLAPNKAKDNDNGWELKRKGGSTFRFDERLLSFPVESEGLPRSFYFNKNRDKQLQRGFNSSISSVFEDFNWRFNKEIRKVQEGENKADNQEFFERKAVFEKGILDKIDEKSHKKTFESLNDKLTEVGLPKIDLSFLDGYAPFDSAFLCQKLLSLDLPVSYLGSGIEMIIALLFLETMSSLTGEQILVLIDEPELHLHPQLQLNLVNHLITTSKKNQIIISTHSPYFFKNCLSNHDIELLISIKDADSKIRLENTGNNFGLFPWSPSWGEINYFAYNHPTIEFHNELYGYLQHKNKALNENNMEAFLIGKGINKSKKWIRLLGGVAQQPYDVTLMTYIRHSLHHPENPNNIPFTIIELKQSIEAMIRAQ